MPQLWAASRAPDTPVSSDASGEPLPPAERDELLQSVADSIRKRGLVTPAILALEIHRPLAWMAGQSLIALTPLFGPLLGADFLQKLSRLLSEEGNVDRLVERLEAS